MVAFKSWMCMAPGVKASFVGWGFMGNYAIRFDFDDGHDTGLFSYDYLEKLREPLKTWSVKGD